jgi:hypothetical protein
MAYRSGSMDDSMIAVRAPHTRRTARSPDLQGYLTTDSRSMPTADDEAPVTVTTFDPAVRVSPRVFVAVAVADPVAGSDTVTADPPLTLTCTVWAVALA